MCEETIQISTLNLNFENKFDDEYFMFSTGIDNFLLYKTIRETGGWEHWEMIELSSYVCECKEDALKIEQEWCEKLRPNLNNNSPFA
jgi:hypothetical protein